MGYNVHYHEPLTHARRYNAYLLKILLRFLEGHKQTLDVGAGTGQFALALCNQDVAVDCVEPEADSRRILQKAGLTAVASLADITDNYSHIYTLNTLEHIEHDIQTLRELHGKLYLGGKLLIYVPAFMCIYAKHDAFVGHFRRYTRKELCTKLQQAGFAIEHARYVDFLGFFAWWLADKLQRDQHFLDASKITLYDRFLFPLSLLCDTVMKQIMGKNLLVIARKI